MFLGGPLSAVSTLPIKVRDQLVFVYQGVHVTDEGLNVELGLVYFCAEVPISERKLLDFVLEG